MSPGRKRRGGGGGAGQISGSRPIPGRSGLFDMGMSRIATPLLRIPYSRNGCSGQEKSHCDGVCRCRWFHKKNGYMDSEGGFTRKYPPGLLESFGAMCAVMETCTCMGYPPHPPLTRTGVCAVQASYRNCTACFEVMGHVCAIGPTQETCPNEKNLQILFTAFAFEGNCRKSRRVLFFFDIFTDF